MDGLSEQCPTCGSNPGEPCGYGRLNVPDAERVHATRRARAASKTARQAVLAPVEPAVTVRVTVHDGPNPPVLTLRPQVAAFAHLMEERLRMNDHREGWMTRHPDELAERALWKTSALAHAIEPQDLQRHGVDAANYVMMRLDAGNLLPTRGGVAQ